MNQYDAGLLCDGGGGDVDWWQHYVRAELDRAHEFYCEQSGIAADEIERLEAIVAKLPETGDGVPIVPGMNLCVLRDGELHDAGVLAVLYDCHEMDVLVRCVAGVEWKSISEDCYSTRAAAQAAGGE